MPIYNIMTSVQDLTAFHLRIDTSMKVIMVDGKIDQYDIPEIILLITDLITTHKMTEADLEESITGMYDYIMSHYNLFPTDEQQKATFNRLFKMCVKLALVQPNVKKSIAKCFSC